ncbi:FISUMP domain-containing protein [Bacteroidota bacterium]
MKTKPILISLIAMLAIMTLMSNSCEKDDEDEDLEDPHSYINDGNVTDPRDGQTYSTVTIGSQTWFAENLNYLTSGSCWCMNDSAYGDVYGVLYTWDAAMTACPDGWKLPSDDEWKTLEMYLGMSQSEADRGSGAGRGTDEGGKMKQTGTTLWVSPNAGATNSSGFTGLPAGCSGTGWGNCSSQGSDGMWWSSTEGLVIHAVVRQLNWGTSLVYRGYMHQSSYASVRCLKN